MKRMQAPEGMASFSHQGYPIDIDGDGIAMVDDRHAGDFLAHGFVEAGRATKPLTATERQNKPSDDFVLKDRLGQLGMSDPRRIAASERLGVLPTETLEMLADIAEGKAALGDVPMPHVEAAEEAPSSATGTLTDADIDAMTKPQLIAWCKEHDLPAIPPITVDDLRAKIRHTLAGG